jgi:hypothetical protein
MTLIVMGNQALRSSTLAIAIGGREVICKATFRCKWDNDDMILTIGQGALWEV